MEQAIYKYDIPIQDSFELEVPSNFRIIYVDCQREMPRIWAIAGPIDESFTRKIRFRLIATGQPFSEPYLVHRGSFQLYNGDLIYHLFEKVM